MRLLKSGGQVMEVILLNIKMKIITKMLYILDVALQCIVLVWIFLHLVMH